MLLQSFLKPWILMVFLQLQKVSHQKKSLIKWNMIIDFEFINKELEKYNTEP